MARSAVIHLDTHMNRIGLLDEEVNVLSENYYDLTRNFDVMFYMSHFYDIKGDNTEHCDEQLRVLHSYLDKLPQK